MAVLRGEAISYERGTPVKDVDLVMGKDAEAAIEVDFGRVEGWY